MFRLLKSARTLVQPSQFGDNLDYLNHTLNQNLQIVQIELRKKRQSHQSQISNHSLVNFTILSKAYLGMSNADMKHQFQHSQTIEQIVDHAKIIAENSIEKPCNFAHVIQLLESKEDQDQIGTLSQLNTTKSQYLESQFSKSQVIQDFSHQIIFEVVSQIKIDSQVV